MTVRPPKSGKSDVPLSTKTGLLTMPSPLAAAVDHLPGDPHRVAVCRADGQFTKHVSPHDIGEIIAQKDQFVWYDIQDPNEHDFQLLAEEFKFHPLALEDAARLHERPKIDMYDGYYFLVFYAISYNQRYDRIEPQAISLFIGRNYIVSVHQGSMQVIHETIERWQKNEEGFHRDAGALLYALLDAIVDDYFPIIDRIADRLDSLEEQIFEKFDPSSLKQIFGIKRDLLGFRRVAAPERDVLNVLIRREVPVFDHASVPYFQDIYDHIIRVTDAIDNYRDLLSSALDAYLSMQSNQLNNLVKVLTLTSIVLMACALVSGIYGMNFDYMPELHWRLGYPFALLLMVIISGSLIWYFKKRGWL